MDSSDILFLFVSSVWPKVSLPFGSVKKRCAHSRIALSLRWTGAPDQEFTDRTTNLGELRRRIGCNGMAAFAAQSHHRCAHGFRARHS